MTVAPALRVPEPLTARHDASLFNNGVHVSLDRWLRERASASEGLSARTYVICPVNESDRVVGYFSISTAIVDVSLWDERVDGKRRCPLTANRAILDT